MGSSWPLVQVKTWAPPGFLHRHMSIATGVFSSSFKKALVTSLLKKTTLDANEVNNYRPVSNLCFVPKIVEKVVAVRFSKHLSDNDLYEQMQSAYRPNHSTETALLRVRNDLLCILDECKAAILVLYQHHSIRSITQSC